VAAGARASLIGTTKRADGRLQVTYNHHPLYMFAKDTKAGQTNGEGVNAFGGVWNVVSPAGGKITKPSSSSGGGGYGPSPLTSTRGARVVAVPRADDRPSASIPPLRR
jgi:Secreted repeat of unknown function